MVGQKAVCRQGPGAALLWGGRTLAPPHTQPLERKVRLGGRSSWSDEAGSSKFGSSFRSLCSHDTFYYLALISFFSLSNRASDPFLAGYSNRRLYVVKNTITKRAASCFGPQPIYIWGTRSTKYDPDRPTMIIRTCCC